jgi:hypothetical protein
MLHIQLAKCTQYRRHSIDALLLLQVEFLSVRIKKTTLDETECFGFSMEAAIAVLNGLDIVLTVVGTRRLVVYFKE